MSNITKPQPQAKRIAPKLKSQILSVRIPAEITKDDLKLLTKYKNHDLPLYTMEIKDGVPSIDNKENFEIHKPTDKLLVNDIEDHFLIKVTGFHLKDSGILENDILLVNRSKKSKHDNIIVAINNTGKAVLKKYVQEEDKAKLISDNENCPDIKLNESSDDIIWGVVTRVIRDYH